MVVSSQSKQLGTWRIPNYTPEFRETNGVGKRPVLTPDEVLRLQIDQVLVIIRVKKILKMDKMNYSKHPEYPKLRSCKASVHIPEWRRMETEKAREPEVSLSPSSKKPVRRKAKPVSSEDSPVFPKKTSHHSELFLQIKTLLRLNL